MISAIKSKIDISSIKSFFTSKLVCYLVPFAFLGGKLTYYVLMQRIPSVTGYYLIHYLYTYNHGYVARGLVGEVISWFADTVTDRMTQGVVIFFSYLLAISASLCIGKALTAVRNDEKRFTWIVFIIIVAFILPMHFETYYHDVKLDKLLWALTFFAVFLHDRKYGIWFVPAFCIIATMVNPVFLFCSMILISIILLQEFHSSKYSLKNGIICAVSYISMIALGLYGTISEKWLGFSTPDELIDYYFARYDGVIDESIRERFLTEWLFDYFESLDQIFTMAYDIYFVDWGNGTQGIINFVLIALPAYIFLSVFWGKIIKAEDNKFQKFIYFLCAVSPLVLIPPISISWESAKYFYNNFMAQAGLVIYFIARGNKSVTETIENIVSYCKKHIIFAVTVAIYFATYLAYFIK